jgi:hypothetical protein
MFNKLLVTILCCTLVAAATAQTYTFAATATPDTVAIGDVVDVTYTLKAPSQEINVLLYDFGAQHCKQLVQTGPTSRNEEMTTDNGKVRHTISQTVSFTVTAAGVISIPRGFAISETRDTIWSNPLTLYVAGELNKEIFPVLKKGQLFRQPEEEVGFDNTFLAEVGYARKSGIEAAAKKTQYPYLLNAGINYHRVVKDSEQDEAVAAMNKLGAEIVDYLKSQKNCAPVGLFIQAHEPRYVFTIQDTASIRQGLDRIYSSYKNMVCNTSIGKKDAPEEIGNFIVARSLWEQADWEVQKLQARHDQMNELRNVFVTITFTSDSAMNQYNTWAASQGYKVFRTGERHRLSHTRFSTTMVYVITSNAKLPTLFSIAALHHQQCKLWRNCRYQRIEADSAKK